MEGFKAFTVDLENVDGDSNFIDEVLQYILKK